jgi:transcriptional regulator with XRE-family HTH domain
MSQDLALQLRAKILGVLLRDARSKAGKSMKELGELIGVSSGTISSIERGTNSLSLPELELIAYFLDLPLKQFWGAEIEANGPRQAKDINADQLLTIRHRTIGAMLRQARMEKNLSQKDLAGRSEISTSRIRRYENGETAVPLPELEKLASSLGLHLEDFIDRGGPVGEWLAGKRAEQTLNQLPRSLQEFIADPENRGYLELAQRLSITSKDKLRSMSEALAELIN